MNKQHPISAQPDDRKHQTKKSIATRNAILDAAVQCFLELGYHRTTTTEIAKRAKVTRGAVQYYFPTTADVLNASINHMIDEWIETYARELRSMTTTGDRFSEGVDIYWDLMNHPVFTAWQELTAASRTDPDLRAIIDEAAVRYDERRNEIGREVYAELGHVPDEVYSAARDLLRVTLEGLVSVKLGNNSEARQQAILSLLKRLMDELLGNY